MLDDRVLRQHKLYLKFFPFMIQVTMGRQLGLSLIFEKSIMENLQWGANSIYENEACNKEIQT